MKDFLCRVFCGCGRDSQPPPSPAEKVQIPVALRAASHRYANAVSNLEGAAALVSKEGDVFNKLLDAMQGDGKR